MSSVSSMAVTAPEFPWTRLSELAPLPKPPSGDSRWPSQTELTLRAARVDVWIKGGDSKTTVGEVCRKRAKELVAKGHLRSRSANEWQCEIEFALLRDSTILRLPTSDGIENAIAELNAWWPGHWGTLDKKDVEKALSQTSRYATHLLDARSDASPPDKMLARLLWIDQLRQKFPDQPLTDDELRQKNRYRRVIETGQKYAIGMSPEVREQIDYVLNEYAEGSLWVPVDGNAVEEAELTSRVATIGLSPLDRSRVVAALLQTAAACESDRCSSGTNVIHPIAGYAMHIVRDEEGCTPALVGVRPGHWQLRIEGQQYVISCELWPRPVVMSSGEFGRTRGSASAILRDVGVSVDSPPGHWKAVWETYGLRNQLLNAADLVDPSERLERIAKWIRQVAATAPAANRPAIDGSPVRMADGTTIADPRWIAERAEAEGVILPHEKQALEEKLRRQARETGTNRRDSSKKQKWLLVIAPSDASTGTPLINTGILET